jgi:hypothetical protein
MERGNYLSKKQENGKVQIIFKPINNTVWLTKNQIATLLECTMAVSNHVRAIFKAMIFGEDKIFLWVLLCKR